jgi:alpha-D-xyloside xylohydrolase
MRGLVMDFPQDDALKDIKDQYLFGPSMMVAPVYVYGARERSVYMPKGANWSTSTPASFTRAAPRRRSTRP